jgi:hypothetical protein
MAGIGIECDDAGVWFTVQEGFDFSDCFIDLIPCASEQLLRACERVNGHS